MKNEEIQYYKGQEIPDQGHPFVVITYSEYSDKILFAEYFIFLASKETKMFYQRLKCDLKKIPKEALNVNKEFMLEEIKNMVEGELHHFMFQYCKKIDNYELLRNEIPLLSIERSPLIRFRLKNMFTDEFEKIKDNSKCKELNDYIYALLKIPTFEISSTI